jgi:hypothetical protein
MTDGKRKVLCKILCELYYRSGTGCLNTILYHGNIDDI